MGTMQCAWGLPRAAMDGGCDQGRSTVSKDALISVQDVHSPTRLKDEFN